MYICLKCLWLLPHVYCHFNCLPTTGVLEEECIFSIYVILYDTYTVYINNNRKYNITIGWNRTSAIIVCGITMYANTIYTVNNNGQYNTFMLLFILIILNIFYRYFSCSTIFAKLDFLTKNIDFI